MRIEIGKNEAGQRLDKYSRKLFKDVPMSKLYKALRKGDIRINEKKAKENYVLCEGDVFTAKYINSETAKKIGTSEHIKVDKDKLKKIYEDNNILIVEKWPGVLTHSSDDSGIPTLTDHVLSYLDQKGDYRPEEETTFKPAPCNRLDRNTSGGVIFGKNFTVMQEMNELIRDRQIDKYYLALINGRIKDGLYEGYIKKNEDKNISKVYKKEVEDSKKISMEVKLLESVGVNSLIEIKLITGRSHQIRAHLKELGHSIVGDRKYGIREVNEYFDNKFALKFQYLYAYKYKFNVEEGKELSYLNNKTITAALPPIFKTIKKDVMRF
ncbi:RluA family pseudouridine synthase [Oceanirhabdus seepicola]|uniref:RNA pseudouridylate synthase n=1 Tax=Oceanirhabdus seepicola TaxID=2828781 RepID=A0A9J6P1H8_9CLOT|nr:RluA family pseudouridine synthase [Oceanirhabdus seepicola]MCM1990610.1 RluA family pseudouridine synthase [Oceanirhabdus seepicola]